MISQIPMPSDEAVEKWLRARFAQTRIAKYWLSPELLATRRIVPIEVLRQAVKNEFGSHVEIDIEF